MVQTYRSMEEALPLQRQSIEGEDFKKSSMEFGRLSTDSSLRLEELDENSSLKVDDGLFRNRRFRQQADIASWAAKVLQFRTRTWIFLCLISWILLLILTLRAPNRAASVSAPLHAASGTRPSGASNPIQLDDVLKGAWIGEQHDVSWVAGPNGEDGMLLEQEANDGEFLSVVDVRANKPHTEAMPRKVLIKHSYFEYNEEKVWIDQAWPSTDWSKVLVLSNKAKSWRHSFSGRYWILDVESARFESLDPANSTSKIQLAKWSPQSNAIAFVRENNLFVRNVSSTAVKQVTHDGGSEVFNGVPDWVYEEEVLGGNSATWWSEDGRYLAFLRTNETRVPTYPISYFVSRPSGKSHSDYQESYPETRQLKYPKAGSPNPVVDTFFYDVVQDDVFSVPLEEDFPEDDRLVTELVWASPEGMVIVKNSNRVSDELKVKLIDVVNRTARIVRSRDLKKLDKGWFEISEHTTYVPKDPDNSRPHAGYIDTVIHDGYDHLAYFTPLDNPEPIMLTSGPWEVVDAPSAVDLVGNCVYFLSTMKSSIERHVYSVNLDGTGLQHISNTDAEGFYKVKFSEKAGFALLSYNGPAIPWQEIRTTPSYKGHLWQYRIEENSALVNKSQQFDIPQSIYSTIDVDGIAVNVLEQRPPNFEANKKYPVLFHVYGGPGSQLVTKEFRVDFQSYVASHLGYIVVTVDGRGTGLIGRRGRTIVRANIGFYEGLDQISAAREWSTKPYVDADKIAIWGWSYGGFMTLKTLELDAGQHFKYGMAVAPVTDWRFYDSIYSERYMDTPENNPDGYSNTSISNMTALGMSDRFLVMHGVSDDNVHLQNTLTLLDHLDLEGVENYDVHIFPDSDHSIYFHNANRIVYDKLSNWIINAFNGEWLKIANATPYANG